jgi:hypothetical protein
MWEIWDYLNESGRDLIADWERGLTTVHRARLLADLAAIQIDDENERKPGAIFPPKLVSQAPIRNYPKLYKLKLQGGPSGANDRLILCRGPLNTNREITLLYGARETNKAWDPPDAPARAMLRYTAVVADPNGRRRKRQRREGETKS